MWEKLREFGPRHCDLPTMVSNVALVLRLLGINIDPRDSNDNISAFSCIVTVVTSASFLYVYIISMIWFVFELSPEERDPVCAVLVFSRAILALVGPVKLMCIRVYQNTMRQILADYLECDTWVVPGSRFAANLAKTLRFVKRRALVFCIGIIVNASIYILVTLLKPGRHHAEDCFVFYGIESMFESPYYETAFALQAASSSIASYGIVFPTAVFVVVIGYTEAQMVALSEEMSLLWDDAHGEYEKNIKTDVKENKSSNTNTDNTVKDNFINNRLKIGLIAIIVIHNTHINLIQGVENVMTNVIALEFMLIGISVIASLLGGLENTYISLPPSLILIGVQCFLGQKVMQAAEDFEMSIYNSKWENFNVSNKKIVLLMLLNAQRGMKLSAGSIATLSYACFMAMIRLIYSGYTTLHSVM